MIHSNSVKNHKIENWTYANAAARLAAGGFLSADVGKLAFQTDNGTYWRLTATTPTWAQAMAGPPGADGAPGSTGPGVPVGGTAGQILAKINGTNYNTQWITPSSGGISWVSPPTSPTSVGTAGDMAYDGRYIYICTATNTWARKTLEEFLATPVYTVDLAYPFDAFSFVDIKGTAGTTPTDATAGMMFDDGTGGGPVLQPRIADNANGPVYHAAASAIYFAKNAAGIWKATDNADPDIAGTTFYTGIGTGRPYPWLAGWSTDALFITKQGGTAGTTKGTQLLGCQGDDNQELVDLPWPFRFMGRDWDCMRVGTNGAVQLGNRNKFRGAGYGFQFPHAAVLGAGDDMGTIIAPFASDLRLIGGGSVNHGTVWKHFFPETDPDTPGDFVIQWDNVAGYGNEATEHLTFQLRFLRSVAGAFKFIYSTMTYAAGSAAAWHFSDIGFQNENGSAGNNIAHNTLLATTNKVIFISP
jgi:hypothetical protein